MKLLKNEEYYGFVILSEAKNPVWQLLLGSRYAWLRSE
jgi:hypothetical protein